jgi:hypothetical protein
MKILPGLCATPDWPGPRCPHCARGIGEGMFDCSDTKMQCLTWERVPAETVARFCRDSVWNNISYVVGTQRGNVLDSITWMTTGEAGNTPLQKLRDGRGLQVLEAQYDEFPVLAVQLEKMERSRQAVIARGRAVNE